MAVRFLTFACLLACVIACARVGCRSRSEGRAEDERGTTADAGAQPAMPVGMLVPTGTTEVPSDAGAGASRLRLARGMKSGSWTEIQIAPSQGAAPNGPNGVGRSRWREDSRFLSIDAMVLLNDAFARAMPGFDSFTPKRFDAPAMDRLVHELDALGKEWDALPNLAAAHTRWDARSELVRRLSDEAEWKRVQGTLSSMLVELSTFVIDTRAKGNELWVVGP